MNQARTRARRPVEPPRPDQIRRPEGRFGWLDDRLLQEGWLSRIGPEGAAVLVLLALAGLMTMAPWDVPPEEIRTVFRRTRQLATHLQNSLALPAPLQLSMGMTDDFEIAIEEGATHVRVGRALFGERL